jgi:hypothetical protein
MKQKIILIHLLFLIGCGPKLVKEKSVKIEKEIKSNLPSLYVIKEKINVRNNFSISSQIITSLNDGDEVQFLQSENGWYQVLLVNGQKGWVRSDLVGPRSLSRTILARAFVDSTLPAFNCEMFFDKEELYRIIYLILPEKYYTSKAKVAEQARFVGKAYQEKVYPGDLEIRIMKSLSNSELFLKVQLEAVNIADVPVPIIQFGRLYALDTPKIGEVDIKILVKPDISDQDLLQMARDISAIYNYPFTKAEIFLITDSLEGLRYLETNGESYKDKSLIRLYYLEDRDGELYEFNISGNTLPTY